jgi:hypothetical protein
MCNVPFAYMINPFALNWRSCGPQSFRKAYRHPKNFPRVANVSPNRRVSSYKPNNLLYYRIAKLPSAENRATDESRCANARRIPGCSTIIPAVGRLTWSLAPEEEGGDNRFCIRENDVESSSCLPAGVSHSHATLSRTHFAGTWRQ